MFEESIMKVSKVLSVALLASGLMLGSVSAVHADSTPLPAATNSAAYQAALAKYQVDILQYRIEIVKIGIAYRVAMDAYWTAVQTAEAKYYADWKAAIEQYQALRNAFQAKVAPLAAVRKIAVQKADAEFLAAIAVSGATNAQLELALKNHAVAIDAANELFKSAVTALGPEPVKPIKPAELIRPPVPVKPAAPAKPVAPGKPAKQEKPEKTPKPDKTKKP